MSCKYCGEDHHPSRPCNPHWQDHMERRLREMTLTRVACEILAERLAKVTCSASQGAIYASAFKEAKKRM